MSDPTGHSRRAVLAACAGGVAALAGCSVGTGGTRLTGSSLEMRDPRRVRATRPTVVGFDEDREVVQVTGFMYYGSSSCNRIALKSAAYEEEDNTLRVRVGVGEKGISALPLPIPTGCTADMAASHYVATFRFAEGLPARVEVVEGRGESLDRRVVDRADQRELCTADHPEGSDAAERAHWTCPEEYVAANVSEGVD